jgi:hypothetical protein
VVVNVPDLVNALFELGGGLFVLNHCRAVLRDKAVAGVSTVSAAFFALWGFWNLYYYPHLEQWFSFTAGVLIVAANVWWVCLLIKYRRRKHVR